MDLLGFGWSEKAVADYSNGRLWASQITDFLTQVVPQAGGAAAPAVLVGNSLGGGWVGGWWCGCEGRGGRLTLSEGCLARLVSRGE